MIVFLDVIVVFVVVVVIADDNNNDRNAPPPPFTLAFAGRRGTGQEETFGTKNFRNDVVVVVVVPVAVVVVSASAASSSPGRVDEVLFYLQHVQISGRGDGLGLF